LEVAAIRALFLRPEVGVVTLTGAAGVGKTRLALAVAAELEPDFGDGVAFVGLAPVRGAPLVLPTIALALGVREVAGQTLLAAIQAALRSQRLLLVLDNFEHVVDAAPMLAELLSQCADLKLLVTSRAPLHMSGEYRFPLAPLAVPPRDAVGRSDPTTLQAYPAVALFCERARAVQPAFSLTPDNAAAVATICVRLDGLPLAIELAAARVAVLSPQALLARLGHRLTLLTGGARDRPVHQQTLSGAIAWSEDLLNEPERRLFRAMSVFVGGCSLRAVEAVCDPGGPGSILDALTALVEQSLLTRHDGAGDEPRFAMFELIHEYARERLDASAAAALLRQRHADHCLALACEAAGHLEHAEQVRWLDLLHQDQDNLRAALQWYAEGQDAAAGLRLATALVQYWFMRGHVAEGRSWLDTFLALPTDAAPAALRAAALNGAGFFARYQSDYDAARTLIAESLALARELMDHQGIATALANLGYVALYQGDEETASALYTESLVHAQTAGDEQGIADARHHLGLIAYRRGDLAGARTQREQCLAIWRRLGDRHGVADTLFNLGCVALAEGSPPVARAYFSDSLACAQELGTGWAVAQALEGFARVAASRSHPERSIQLAAAAAALRQATGAAHSAAGEADLARDLEPARRVLTQDAFAVAWAAGQALTMDQAIAYACTLDEPPEEATTGARPPRLTAREIEVLCHVAAGDSNPEIADRLVLSVKTVERHIANIYAKIGAHSRAEAAVFALRHGLVP
jgi:non-specific serine/threonine protein kinase